VQVGTGSFVAGFSTAMAGWPTSCFYTLIQSSDMLVVVLGVEPLLGMGHDIFSNLTSVVFILL
jgi:hypothetical protein